MVSMRPVSSEDLAALSICKHALAAAIERERSNKWLLRLWSRFIKARDAFRCLCCEATERIQAHHIIRRHFTLGALLTSATALLSALNAIGGYMLNSMEGPTYCFLLELSKKTIKMNGRFSSAFFWMMLSCVACLRANFTTSATTFSNSRSHSKGTRSFVIR
jgi:hypothetical protein